MKKSLHNVFLALALILIPSFLFAQPAPNLGTTSSFAFYTAGGAFSVVGATAVTGDVGTHVGAFTGFPPGVLVGTKHVANPTTALAFTDVGVAYGYMSTLICGNVIGTPILTQTLAPGVHCTGGAAVLAGDLTLDGGGDPNAKFYIKINGALATNNSTKIILKNGAQWSNVYWQINGQFTGGNSSVFMGTILGAGAITFNGSSTLYGRGLTNAGAISLNDMTAILPPPLTVSTTQVNAGCFGTPTGSATAIPAGGVPPYSYSWNTLPVQTTATATGLVAGNYIVTVTDILGTTATANVIITQPLAFVLTSANVTSPILCNGGTATVTLVTNGGTAPISYTFNGVTNTTGVFIGVLPGLAKPYSITDANNCGPLTGTINVTQPLLIGLTSAAVTSPILCNGGTARVTIVANGGTAPYSYTFNGVTNATGLFMGVLPGLAKPYSITDANNCGPLTGTIDVTQPLVFALTSASITSPILCNGGKASVSISVNGGTPPYSYTFDGNTNNTGLFNGVSAGLNKPYTIADSNGCAQVTGTLSITEPLMMTISTTQVNVLCFGSSSASATALPQGGSAPYNYSWNTIPVQTTATASNLSAGNYIVTVIDNTGCMATANVSIQQPLAALMVSTTQVDALCFGSSSASATALPQGGSAPYSYSWNTIPVQTTATASNLSAGNYIVTVIDNSGCITTANVSIQQPLAALMVSTTKADALCFGSSSASATALPQGGTAPYSYSWNTIPVQTTATANNLSSGNYIVTVTDNSGCIATANVSIQQPLNALMVSTTQVNVLCFGSSSASATALPQGGSAPYSYSWNTIPVQTTATANNLSAGNYIVTVIDNTGCIATANVSIQQPLNALMVSTTQVNVLCFGSSSASATALVQGGSAPYRYSWNTIPVQTTATANNLSAGNYIVTVTDNDGCMATANVSIQQPLAALMVSTTKVDALCFGSSSASATALPQGGSAPYSYSWNTIPVQTTATANNLSSGNYIVTVTDNDGCMATANVSIQQPLNALNVSITKNDVQCFGSSSASATAIVQGGTAPYSYSWNTLPVQTTATANNLSAGNYMVTVIDNSGCIGTANVIINQPAEVLVVNTMKTDVLCFGDATGSATAQVQGGTAPYSYTWNTIPVQTTAAINNLKAGNYMVTVTDNSGCIATANVIINQPLMGLMVNPIQTNVLCFGEATGSATAIPTGGTAPYTYLWNTIPAQTTATVNNLPAGNYTVRVTDRNNCIATANVSITQPEPITGSAMAAIVLTGQGGIGPLIYTLNGVSNNTGIFTNIDSGIVYNWSITDANNCKVASGTTGLCLNPLALVVIDKVNVLCFNGNTGSIRVEASGGTGPYEYKLNNSPNQVSGTFNSLTAGAYTVTVKDAKGLTSSIPVTITQPTLLTVSTIKTDILCEGLATGSATALAQGGTAPYLYSWNTLPVKTTATANGLNAGTYTVMVTDANGCTATAQATIVASNSLPTAAFTSSQSGLSTYTFVNTSVNATSYAWDFGDGQASIDPNPIHVYATAGTYTVKLTVANSCGTDIETQVLIVPELEFFNGFSPNGDGQNDNWNIPVLNYYPVNTVLIINRWGSEIWKGTNYNNKDVVWTGKNMNGEDMPDGTYYYIINYDNIEKRGWVFIKR